MMRARSGRWLVIPVLLSVASAPVLRAQMAPSAVTRSVPAAADLGGRRQPQAGIPAPEFIRQASAWIGWGGAIGAVGGFLYGEATISDKPGKGLLVLAEMIGGFVVGMIGGAVAFIVARAIE